MRNLFEKHVLIPAEQKMQERLKKMEEDKLEAKRIADEIEAELLKQHEEKEVVLEKPGFKDKMDVEEACAILNISRG